MGAGRDPLLESWGALFAALARAGGAAASRLAERDGGEAVWAAVEAQAKAWGAVARNLGGAAESQPGAAALARFLDPAQWLFGGDGAPEPALRRLIEAPVAFGRAAPLDGPAAQALATALARHRALVARAYVEAAQEAARRAAADPPLTLAAGQAIWVAALGRLDALHGDPAFLDSQTRVVEAAVAAREAEAEAVAAFCRDHGLPTRAEFDEMAETIVSLRRELRSLKRALDQP